VVLAEGVEGVEHLDGHQHGQRQRHGLGLAGLQREWFAGIVNV